MHQVTTSQVVAHCFFLADILMFMLGIQLMAKVRTARRGNGLASVAMLLAMVGQFIEMGTDISWGWIFAGIIVGSGIGGYLALKRQFTEMPELVGLLNGCGGLASVFVSLAIVSHIVKTLPSLGDLNGLMGIDPKLMPDHMDPMTFVNAWAVMLTIIVGGLTFTGSMVAYGKLSEIWGWKIKILGKTLNKPIMLPHRHIINCSLLALALVLSILAIHTVGGVGCIVLVVLVTILSLALEVGLVLAIGGGDMPVVISLLNSYSGVAAALAGFAINEPVLIVSGSLVGASGLILTRIMCKAMNRSLGNVLFGGFGDDAAEGSSGSGEYMGVRSTDVDSAAQIFATAQSMIVVPGYGMAVAQAQHCVHELAELLIKRGCVVRFAIHPVAGRMPGHMNILLAEAKIPYDQMVEMEEINKDFRDTDVVLVIGANDVVNPAAHTDEKSPIYGMPILDVVHARSVYTIKRSLSPGFAGIKNTLFEAPNNEMLFGDAKKVVEELIKAIKDA